MLRRLREDGPVVLVPAAWTVVTAAHLDVVSGATLLAAHVVMVTIMVAFLALSWGEMADGALRTWRLVVLVGTGLTLAGVAGLAGAPGRTLLLAVALVGWMVAPAVALFDTGRRVGVRTRAYAGGGGTAALGAVVYLIGLLAGGGPTVLVGGLVLVGAGQTVGIAAAVLPADRANI